MKRLLGWVVASAIVAGAVFYYEVHSNLGTAALPRSGDLHVCTFAHFAAYAGRCLSDDESMSNADLRVARVSWPAYAPGGQVPATPSGLMPATPGGNMANSFRFEARDGSGEWATMAEAAVSVLMTDPGSGALADLVMGTMPAWVPTCGVQYRLELRGISSTGYRSIGTTPFTLAC